MADKQEAPNRKLLLAYAEGSRDLALPLARALEAAAFDVMHASSQQAHSDAALEAARTVLVCWTPAAVASDAVTLHAARAQKAGKLASVLLAPCTPPSSFEGQYLLADLSSWRGDPTDRQFVQLVHAIHARQSRRLLRSAPQWAARYMSWGSLGAVALGTVAIVANLGDVRQTIDGVFNPAASEAEVNAIHAKVDEMLALTKRQFPQQLSEDTEAALRESLERLLSAQTGARGSAARKLANGDVDGALADLNTAAKEGENVVAGLSQTWQEIGALHYPLNTDLAIDAYQRAVELTPGDLSARYQLGTLLVRSGDLAEAEDAFVQLLAGASQSGKTSLAAASWGHLGVIARTRGNLQTARENILRALDLNQAAGDRQGQANDLGDLGEIARMQADFTGAETYFRQSLALFQELGDRNNESIATSRLGAVARDRKRYAEAEALYKDALAIANESGDREGRMYAYVGLGDIALDRGRLEDALASYRQSYKAADELSANESRAVALVGMADVSERMGDKPAARDMLREALATYAEMGLLDDLQDLEARFKKLDRETGSASSAH